MYIIIYINFINSFKYRQNIHNSHTSAKKTVVTSQLRNDNGSTFKLKITFYVQDLNTLFIQHCELINSLWNMHKINDQNKQQEGITAHCTVCFTLLYKAHSNIVFTFTK